MKNQTLKEQIETGQYINKLENESVKLRKEMLSLKMDNAVLRQEVRDLREIIKRVHEFLEDESGDILQGKH